MANEKIALLGLGIIYSLIAGKGVESSITCYECNGSTGSQNCNDKFKDAGILIQSCNDTSCYKVTVTIGDHKHIERGCASTLGDKACDTDTVNNVNGKVCICSTDLCNSSQSLLVSFNVLLFVILGSLIWMSSIKA